MYYLVVTGEVVSCGNEYIIHVDEKFGGVFLSEWVEHSGHGTTKGSRGVTESKVHDFGLV